MQSLAFTTDKDRWTAIAARDKAADGAFFYAVRTTGVYCRASCGSRQARRENVAFYATPEEAEKAGFRPCLRCRPREAADQGKIARVTAACRKIETAEEMPKLADLAKAAGTSPAHFHRLFKGVTGVTPKAYAAQTRTNRMHDLLPKSASVTEAIFAAGFNSSGRFYENSRDVLGMDPSRFQKGGEGTIIRFALGQSSLGTLLVAATEHGLCAIFLGDDKDALERDLRERFPKAAFVAAGADFETIVADVARLVDDPSQGLDLPKDVRGTAFQRRVWQALSEIPHGETRTYREIAMRIGAPQAVRAVAGACAANPLAIAIPCHRVLRSDGALSGYRWGAERKRALLARETKA
jgi:AraC family transcriptional regulator of adaptative response/methylated-DNA-[protein]-cysteine methyltransferase